MPQYTKPQRSDQLDYVQSMLGQLHHMAKADGHGMLAYLIEMACIEAAETLRNADLLGFRQEKGN